MSELSESQLESLRDFLEKVPDDGRPIKEPTSEELEGIINEDLHLQTHPNVTPERWAELRLWLRRVAKYLHPELERSN
jgi:hypothetical protein